MRPDLQELEITLGELKRLTGSNFVKQNQVFIWQRYANANDLIVFITVTPIFFLFLISVLIIGVGIGEGEISMILGGLIFLVIPLFLVVVVINNHKKKSTKIY